MVAVQRVTMIELGGEMAPMSPIPDTRRGTLDACRGRFQLAPVFSMRANISPDRACRLSLDFSKTGMPSRSTSNLPPRDGISSTVEAGKRSLSSAARLAARGS